MERKYVISNLKNNLLPELKNELGIDDYGHIIQYALHGALSYTHQIKTSDIRDLYHNTTSPKIYFENVTAFSCDIIVNRKRYEKAFTYVAMLSQWAIFYKVGNIYERYNEVYPTYEEATNEIQLYWGNITDWYIQQIETLYKESQ